MWSSLVLSVIVYLELRPGSDAIGSGKNNPDRKGVVELCHVSHSCISGLHTFEEGEFDLDCWWVLNQCKTQTEK